MAAQLEAEDKTRRAKADADLKKLGDLPQPSAPKLSLDDLNDAEVDFTVQGKVGSCGSCALGDAFR